MLKKLNKLITCHLVSNNYTGVAEIDICDYAKDSVLVDLKGIYAF